MSPIEQIFTERDHFIALFLEVLLLGAILNYMATVLFEIINPTNESNVPFLAIQLGAVFIGAFLLFYVIARIVVFKPIEMRTTFYTGIIMRQVLLGKSEFHLASQEDANSVQGMLCRLKNNYPYLAIDDPEVVGETIQFAVLDWYKNTF